MALVSKELSGPVGDFTRQGFLEFAGLERQPAAYALYDAIYLTRPFDSTLFLTEAEWEKSGKSHAQTNPRAGKNILESLQDKLAFVETHAGLRQMLERILGEDFHWAFKKVVCRMPRSLLPAWVNRLVGDRPANTLNAFVRPEYRDISYYIENDLHQDIQDYPRLPEDKREHRILSLYVHLSDIGSNDAPLYLLPGTHQFGATSYQHDIYRLGETRWQYRDDDGRAMETELHPILGPAGHIALWHSCLIHGARPITQVKPRLVLRYMLARSPSAVTCGLDAVNAAIDGPLYPARDDSAGAHANKDGGWNLVATDFTRMAN